MIGKVKEAVEEYRELFYDKRKFKTVPDYILNADYNIRYNFFIGYYMGDGSKTRNCISFATKGMIGSAQHLYLAKSIGVVPRITVRSDKKISLFKKSFIREKKNWRQCDY